MDLSIPVLAIVSYSICMRMRVGVFGEREREGTGKEGKEGKEKEEEKRRRKKEGERRGKKEDVLKYVIKYVIK